MRSIQRLRSWTVPCRLFVIAAVFFASLATWPTGAQYVYNPNNADEQPGIKYFGSAKSDKGALLPGVSILLTGERLSYLMVTDDQGRFRITVPLDMLPESVTIKCFKAGMQLVQMNKRLGPKGPRITVQVDCILRAQ